MLHDQEKDYSEEQGEKIVLYLKIADAMLRGAREKLNEVLDDVEQFERDAAMGNILAHMMSFFISDLFSGFDLPHKIEQLDQLFMVARRSLEATKICKEKTKEEKDHE